MKKKIAILTIIVTILVQTVYANNTYELVSVNHTVFVGGQYFDMGDSPVLNYNGTTYLPLRKIAEATGVNVEWLEDEKMISLTDEESINYKSRIIPRKEYYGAISSLYMEFYSLSGQLKSIFYCIQREFNLKSEDIKYISSDFEVVDIIFNNINYTIDDLEYTYFVYEDEELTNLKNLAQSYSAAISELKSAYEFDKGAIEGKYTYNYAYEQAIKNLDNYKTYKNSVMEDAEIYNKSYEYRNTMFNYQ